MTEKILENFSIAQICESGQCFRMEEIQDGRYQVIAGDRYLELEQQENRVRFDCTEVEYRDFWRHYFDIETDYAHTLNGEIVQSYCPSLSQTNALNAPTTGYIIPFGTV